jgi:hypothetical protein
LPVTRNPSEDHIHKSLNGILEQQPAAHLSQFKGKNQVKVGKVATPKKTISLSSCSSLCTISKFLSNIPFSIIMFPLLSLLDSNELSKMSSLWSDESLYAESLDSISKMLFSLKERSARFVIGDLSVVTLTLSIVCSRFVFS